MKKSFIILTLMALCAMSCAQTYYHVVYRPGTGEHQFGFTLAPSFAMGAQRLGVTVKDVGAADYVDATGRLTNAMGVGAGVFYGYETVGNTLDWGNYTSLSYAIAPFTGKVDFATGGVTGTHKVDYLVHQIQLQFNPFLAYRINDQFSVSAGLGLDICPWLPSKVRLDGEALESSDDSETTILKALLNSHIDANVGVKYWFSDELFVGLRLQYGILNILDVIGGLDEESEEVVGDINGVVGINLDNGTGRCTILPVKNLQAVFSVGFVW